MAGYINLDPFPAEDVRLMHLAVVATANVDIDADAALDAINELVRASSGPRQTAVLFAKAASFLTMSAASTPEVARSVMGLTATTLEAAADVKFEAEFDAQLDHAMTHGWSGGGPDPDCPYCTEEDA